MEWWSRFASASSTFLKLNNLALFIITKTDCFVNFIKSNIFLLANVFIASKLYLYGNGKRLLNAGS